MACYRHSFKIHYGSIRRYLSTLLQAACMPSAANSARPWGTRFDDLAVCAEKLPGRAYINLS
jgi:hypothetical protein